MEISKEKKFVQRRNERLHYDEIESSYENKLKTANKARNNRKLFLEGLAWFHDGKTLESAIDIIELDGVKTQKKDNISFKRGYEEGIYELGFRYGYNSVPYANIPKEFASYERCKTGYRDGKERKILDDSKKKNGSISR